MFFGPLKEGDVVPITDSNAIVFKELMQFIYLPEIDLTMENFEEVVRLADKYGMLECFEKFAEFLECHVTTDNILMAYQLAIQCDNSRLKAFCERRIRVMTQRVLNSKAFLRCKREVVEHILHQDTLECSELDLFHHMGQKCRARKMVSMTVIPNI